MGTKMRTFDHRFDGTILNLAREALRKYDKVDPEMRVLREFRDWNGAPVDLSLSWRQADVFLDALCRYTESELRRGSDAHKATTELMGALRDYVRTGFRTEVMSLADKMSEATKKLVGGPIPTPVEKLDQRLKEKRDAIFREMIGKPADLTIWGTPKKPEPETPQGRVPATEQRNRVRTLEGVVDTKPIADIETNEELTGGDTTSFNDEMKREGAGLLLKMDQNRGAGQEMTSAEEEAFIRKLAQAQEAGDQATEIQLLGSLWV